MSGVGERQDDSAVKVEQCMHWSVQTTRYFRLCLAIMEPQRFVKAHVGGSCLAPYGSNVHISGCGVLAGKGTGHAVFHPSAASSTSAFEVPAVVLVCGAQHA